MNFNIGDRVLCTGSAERNGTTKNKEGTIIGFQNNNKNIPCVEFDSPISGGHAGDPFKGKDKHCWNFWRDTKYLELISTSNVQRTSLERKCRKLWNDSNFVKNNPKHAY